MWVIKKINADNTQAQSLVIKGKPRKRAPRLPRESMLLLTWPTPVSSRSSKGRLHGGGAQTPASFLISACASLHTPGWRGKKRVRWKITGRHSEVWYDRTPTKSLTPSRELRDAKTIFLFRTALFFLRSKKLRRSLNFMTCQGPERKASLATSPWLLRV